MKSSPHDGLGPGHCKYFMDFLLNFFIELIVCQFDSYRTSVGESGKTGLRPSRLVGKFPHSKLLGASSFPNGEHGDCGLYPRFRGFFPLSKLFL